MVPAARAAPRLEANTTLPRPASFRNSRRSIGCFMDDSSREKEGAMRCNTSVRPRIFPSRRNQDVGKALSRAFDACEDAKLATPRLARKSVAQYQPAHLPRGDYLAVHELLVIALDRWRHVQVVDHQAQRLAQALLGDICQPVDALQLGAIVEVKP